MSSANRILLNSTELSCDFLFSICLLFSLCSLLLSSLLLSSLLSSSLWLDRSANFCLMLLTFFLDSLSTPLIIVTISVQKRRVKMTWVDNQVFMFCVPKVDGMENEESMWKHSPKSKVASQVRLLLLICVPSKNFFAENLVDSIIIVTFAVSYPYWKLQLGEGGMDIYT